jgi:5-methylcytosine-specific restriction protein A
MMVDDITVVPSPQQYAAAFHEIGSAVTPVQIQMLRIHFEAPKRTITATGMSQAFGYRYQYANLHYGRLAHLVGEKLDFSPDSVYLGLLVEFEKRNDEWHWIMREELVQALEILGWV